MRFTEIHHFKKEKFRRLAGVKKTTFNKMVEILTKVDELKMAKGGRPSKLSIQDKLLMMLEYWRENRTFLQLGSTYGLSESNASNNVKWAEDTLVESGLFSLPGKKALRKKAMKHEILLIDATEVSIRRPKNKKNSENTTPAKKVDTRKKCRSSPRKRRVK